MRLQVPLLPVVAAGLLGLAWRRAPRALVLLTAALVLVAAGAHVHLWRERTQWSRRSEARVAAELRRLERRKTELVSLLHDAANRVSAPPENRSMNCRTLWLEPEPWKTCWSLATSMFGTGTCEPRRNTAIRPIVNRIFLRRSGILNALAKALST